MNEYDLINELKNMYEYAGKGEKVASIHLFGIIFADNLVGYDLKNIAKRATSKESYHSEISKGISLKKLLDKKNIKLIF